jgi:hypothetical protein
MSKQNLTQSHFFLNYLNKISFSSSTGRAAIACDQGEALSRMGTQLLGTQSQHPQGRHMMDVGQGNGCRGQGVQDSPEIEVRNNDDLDTAQLRAANERTRRDVGILQDLPSD